MKGAELTLCTPPLLAWGPGWLIANKPSGMSVHNDPEGDLCTLLKRYIQSYPDAAAAVAYDTAYGLHPVHRLDRETSGLILLSCRRDVFDELSLQMRGGTATKEYTALVHGPVEPDDEWRAWDWPLTPRSAGRRNPRGQGRRKPCKTLYRVIRQSPHYSLIACRLLTGRTHQIRRHAVLAGHPMVGDRRYGSLRACKYLETHHNFTRLGLHAAALTIRLPGEETIRRIADDKLPAQMADLIDKDIEDGKDGVKGN